MSKHRPLIPRRTSPSPQRDVRGEVKIELDWKAYFLEFCKVHGEPVRFKDSLLFHDGWRYSAVSYEGPEWSPPQDHFELDTLVTQYWLIRKREVQTALTSLLFKLKSLEEIKGRCSLRLQQAVYVDDGEGGKVRGYKPLDLSGMKQREEWLRQDLETCDVRLRELEDEAIRHATNQQRPAG